jgi:ketosteroid isomerase-like protein
VIGDPAISSMSTALADEVGAISDIERSGAGDPRPVPRTGREVRMYKAAVRWMIRRNITKLNEGDYRPALAMFREDAILTFPGDNSWANRFRRSERGRVASVTHRGRTEIEAFMRRYVEEGIQMRVEDVLVNGPPWNTRVAIRVHDWVEGTGGHDRYNNRAVLFVTTAWGKIRTQEDYEDTQRAADFDAASRVLRVNTTATSIEQVRDTQR